MELLYKLCTTRGWKNASDVINAALASVYKQGYNDCDCELNGGANAALAAERRSREMWEETAKKLDKQLAKPTTGEWTAKTVKELTGVSWDSAWWNTIADAHEAALAAQRDKTRMSEVRRIEAMGDLKAVEKQLAAERDSAARLSEALSAAEHQLTDERERLAQAYQDNQNLRDDRDAETAKVQPLVDALANISDLAGDDIAGLANDALAKVKEVKKNNGKK